MHRHLGKTRGGRAVAIALVLALTAAACGGEDDADETAPEAEEPEAEEPAAEEPEAEEPDAEEPEAEASGDGSIDDYYAGETVRILVPTGPGGGQDARAQYMAPYWRECLPGQPAVEPFFVPGGGGVAGGNEFELATERDGRTITQTSQSMATNEFLGNEEVEFSRGNLEVYMVFPNSGAMVARTDTGIESIQDLADQPEPLFIGGTSPLGSDLMAILALEVLGLSDQVQYVWGYESSGDHRLAFEQNETQLDAGPTTNYVSNIQPLVEDGMATPVLFYGLPSEDATTRVQDPQFGGPTVEEAHEELYGELPSGPEYDAYIATLNTLYGANTVALHVDDPPEAKEAVAEAVRCMVEEQDFLELYVSDEVGPESPIVDQEVIAPLMDALSNVDPEIQDWIWDYLTERFPREVQEQES